MKVCPKCQKTYTDKELNFCLDDGAALIPANRAGKTVPATMIYNQPRLNEPVQFSGAPAGNQNNWNDPNQTAPKKSKTWLWAIGIIGAVVLLCGGSLTGFIFYAANREVNNRNTNSTSVSDSQQKNPTPYDRKPSEKNPVSNNGTNVQKVDLAKWADGKTEMGACEFKDGELRLSSAKKKFYYVLASSSTVYKTEDAATKVTVRNVDDAASQLGYGLIIHSNPVPLKQDYAFLIDSVNKKYRIVRHKPGEEIVVVAWTRSAAIKDGGDENILEVRDQNKKMNFYINGEFIKTVDNEHGFDGGVTGLYSGDAVDIAFSDLEISK